MPKLKPGTILPTPEEDIVLTKAALSDPDALPYTEEEWAQVTPVRGGVAGMLAAGKRSN